MLRTVPDFAPYFVDAGPALRVRAGLLLRALGAACMVMVWNPRDTVFRYLPYRGRKPVDPGGCSRAQVIVTMPDRTTYIARFQNREPTATDVDGAVAGILEAVFRARYADRDASGDETSGE